MAEPLSIDLRERVVAAVKGGMSRRRAAAHFRVGVSSAIRWAAQAEATGDLRPKPMGGDHRSAAIEAQAETILALLAEEPDTTLTEYQEALEEKGRRFSVSAIWRFLDRRGLTLKKRMARPVCKRICRDRRLIGLLQRIRPGRQPPGQDGDTRAPVLIKTAATNAVF
jgi:transposase